MRAIVFTILSLAASASSASDWRQIYSDPTMVLKLDFQSISQSGRYKKAWFLTDYATPQDGASYTSYHKYKSTKSLIYFLCSERTTTIPQTSYYEDFSGSGANHGSLVLDIKNSTHSEVVPDSIGELQFEYICGKRK